MKKLVPILLIAGGYLGYKYFKIKNAIDGLQIKVSGIDLNSIGTGLLETSLNCFLSVFNPSNTDLSFRQFVGTIFFQGTPIVDFNVSQPVVLKSNSISQVPMDAVTQNLNLLSVAGKLLHGDLNDFVLQGTINISGIHVPVNIILGDG